VSCTTDGTTMADLTTTEDPPQMVRIPANGVLDLRVDKSAMYISPLPITNGSEDRQGERINPDGVIMSVFESNPVVFYNHSHAFAPLVPPVGLAVTPDQKFDVHREGDVWFSGCLFSQANKFAVQVFHLICEGVIRGRSIGGLTHKASHYKPQLMPIVFANGQIRPARPSSVQYDAVEIYEWSWTPLPQNRDIVTTVKSLLSNDTIDGQKMDPLLKACLLNMDLAEPAQFPGYTLTNPNSSGAKSMEQSLNNIVAVTFSGEYSPGQASDILRNSPLFRDTELVFDAKTSSLKSIQVKYNGPTQPEEIADMPGVTVLRALKCDGPMKEQGGMPEGAAALVTDQTADIEKMEVPENVLVDDVAPPEESKPVKPSVKYLGTFVAKMDEMAAQASAALAEIENPQALDESSAVLEILAELRERLAALHDEIGATEVEPLARAKKADVEVEISPEEDAEESSVEKRLLTADLFYGRRCRVPRSLFAHVSKAVQFLSSGGDTKKATTALQNFCKGVMPENRQQPAPEAAQTPEVSPDMAGLFSRLERSTLRNRAKGIVS